MAITKTTVTIRPNTSVPFYVDAGQAAIAAGNASVLPKYQAGVQAYRNAGVTADVTISEDGLTQTRVITYPDLAALGTVDSAYGMAGLKEYHDYKINNDYTVYNLQTIDGTQRSNLSKLEGIDAPYTVTTTYTFTSATDPFIDTFVAGIETFEHFGKLTDLVINGADVVVTHQYLNSADQSANPYVDMFFIPMLLEKDVTRTVVYAMV